jgi:glyoxalase family protein
MNLLGLHHISGITGKIEANHAFYTQTLGMRLVKKTVNQDDVRAYHLFYADQRGSPGSDITFFDWANASPARYGNHSISRTGLRVPSGDSIMYWQERLSNAGITTNAPEERNNRLTLDFSDFEGQRLSLIADSSTDNIVPWTNETPVEHAIRGLGAVTLTIPQAKPTTQMLTNIMNMKQIAEYASPNNQQYGVVVYQMTEGGSNTEIHLEIRPDLPPARPGAGGMHHIAFRVPNATVHAAWLEHLSNHGIRHSGLIDRYYFKAAYFREPNGIQFEISTDDPGFATDEPEATLGQRLALPPFLENRRADIEQHLKNLEF